MASNQLRVNWHVQLSFTLGQLVDSDYLHLLAIWSKGTFGMTVFWNRVHVMPGTIRTKTTGSDI